MLMLRASLPPCPHPTQLLYLPPCSEVLVMVMRKHQRYFPVYRPQSDALLPHFVTVANGEVDLPTVQVG